MNLAHISHNNLPLNFTLAERWLRWRQEIHQANQNLSLLSDMPNRYGSIEGALIIWIPFAIIVSDEYEYMLFEF